MNYLLSFLTDGIGLAFIPVMLLFGIFQLFMLVDAIRQKEWIWALFIMVGSGFGAFYYYMSVYRFTRPTSGFELPGASTRRRIRELQAKIHHLDNARHHYELGDVYFAKGQWEKAEQCYRAALTREPNDIDARAHLGQVLLRQKKTAEAQAILEKVCNEDPKHDYGHSLMAYAEALAVLGEKEGAITVWKMVLNNNSYARARVQLAELYIGKGQADLARKELLEVINGAELLPKFQRKRERVWLRRAKGLLRKTGR